jgi:DNA-directed RNA polymerase I, II, and III subunit RPABC1
MQPVYQEMLILSQSKTPIRHYILIIEAPFTPKVRDEIATNYPYLRIEVFMFEEMLFNPTIHYLVPQHEVLTPDEVQELASHIDLSKIPWISVEDPIVRYYGYKVGDVLRIHRRNMVLDTIVDQYITYRMVKNTPLVRHTR